MTNNQTKIWFPYRIIPHFLYRTSCKYKKPNRKRVNVIGRVTLQAARKRWNCSKCGKVIFKNEKYYALKINFHPVVRRCLSCGFKNWEKSGSSYIRQIGRLQDYVANNELDETDYEEIIEELSDLASELEDSMNNLPDNLQESETKYKIEERLESVNEALEALEDDSMIGQGVTIKEIVEQVICY